MTTDHGLIARACRLLPGFIFFTYEDGLPGSAGVRVEDDKGWVEYTASEEALHALLVFRLAMLLAARPYVWHEDDTEQTCIVMSTGGHGWCVWRELGDGSSEIGLDKANTGELREPIDIIRALVDALEECE